MSAFTELGRIGDNMKRAVRLTADNGPYGSIGHLGRDVAPDASRSSGTDPVYRCIDRGLLEVDPDHEMTSPGSNGAVVLTEYGERFISMFSFGDTTEAAAGSAR